jgi:hypothetical protein
MTTKCNIDGGTCDNCDFQKKHCEYKWEDKDDTVVCGICGDEFDSDRDDYITTTSSCTLICQTCLEGFVDKSKKDNGKAGKWTNMEEYTHEK